ncbi:hypothetical protein K470DRAFT_173432 [Piedraia hortae CBS 480.64]|uniref:Uncharacterized protein n=1 Tax=Piedraia hortae CBS 480.64 TaxID=1314780 RepID=A0A6A7C4V8_9PEZI|nr:hypothetical protein K470DRAFT_173432 [Piedraia hortae CBS 480.64]
MYGRHLHSYEPRCKPGVNRSWNPYVDLVGQNRPRIPGTSDPWLRYRQWLQQWARGEDGTGPSATPFQYCLATFPMRLDTLAFSQNYLSDLGGVPASGGFTLCCYLMFHRRCTSSPSQHPDDISNPPSAAPPS